MLVSFASVSVKFFDTALFPFQGLPNPRDPGPDLLVKRLLVYSFLNQKMFPNFPGECILVNLGHVKGSESGMFVSHCGYMCSLLTMATLGSRRTEHCAERGRLGAPGALTFLPFPHSALQKIGV